MQTWKRWCQICNIFHIISQLEKKYVWPEKTKCIIFFCNIIVLGFFPDDAIQNLILEAPWFKSCKRLCAYISCSALREVDTSKVLQDVLQNPTKGVFLLGFRPMNFVFGIHRNGSRTMDYILFMFLDSQVEKKTIFFVLLLLELAWGTTTSVIHWN